jgi:hypothetical protein
MNPLILISFLFVPFKSKVIINDVRTFSKNDSFPSWVKRLYETNNDEFLNNAIPEVIFFKKLSDSISYCLYRVDDGVCEITFVATQKNKKKLKRFKVGNECDEDYAYPIYSTRTYEHDTANSRIKLSIYTEKANPKYLIKTKNGAEFKNGYDMENTTTIKYSLDKIVAIEKSGNIKVTDKK